jgi:hypothetical protein
MLDVWQKTFIHCQLCMKHVFFKSGKGMSTISCCIDFHDNLLYGLGIMDRMELFGIQKSKFKKANLTEVKKNKKHICKLMMKVSQKHR